MILKTSLTAGFAHECLLAHNVYDKEIEFYGKIVPQINRLLCKLGDSDDLVAETIGVCDVNKAMLFEDLTMKGFRMASIQRGFSVADAKIILRKLAKFHACGSTLQANQPEIFANYKHGQWKNDTKIGSFAQFFTKFHFSHSTVGAISRGSNVFHNFYYFHLDSLIESIADWPDSSRYVPKLQKLRSNVVERGCKMFDANPADFNTLNHGDFWLNNNMVKQKEAIGCSEMGSQSLGSDIDDVIFIDFQDSCWSSPAIDLHYFLNTSLHESDRPQAFNELIDVYYAGLANALKRLNYCKSIPTQHDFHEQFNARNFYGKKTKHLIFPLMTCFGIVFNLNVLLFSTQDFWHRALFSHL